VSELKLSFKALKDPIVNALFPDRKIAWKSAPHHIPCQSYSQEEADEYISGFDVLEWIHAYATLKADSYMGSRRIMGVRSRALVAAQELIKELSLQVKQDPAGQPDYGAVLPQRQSVFLSLHEKRNLPIVLDTGASMSITPYRQDFCSRIDKGELKELTGLSHKTRVAGVGMIKWTVRDVFGQVRSFKTKGYYVPDANIRLFSPQTYMQEQKGGKVVLTHRMTSFFLPDGFELQFPYQQNNNLPLMLTADPASGHQSVRQGQVAAHD